MRTVEEHRAVVAGLLPPTPATERPARRCQRAGAGLRPGRRRSTSHRSGTPRWTATPCAPSTSRTCRSRCRCPRTSPPGATDVGPLEPGTAARIMTGAPLPDGAEVIIPVEQTDGGVDWVRIDVGTAGRVCTSAPGARTSRPAPWCCRRHRTRPAPARHRRGARAVRTLPRPPPGAGAGAVHRVRTGRARASPCGPGQIYESNAVDAGRRRSSRIGASDPLGALRRRRRRDASARPWIRSSGRRRPDRHLRRRVGGGLRGGQGRADRATASSSPRSPCSPGMPQGAGRVDGVPDRDAARATRSARSSPSRCSCGRRSGRPWAVRTRTGRRYAAAVARASTPRPASASSGAGVLDAVAGTVAPWGGPGSHLLSWLAGADAIIVVPEDVTHLDAGRRRRGLAAGLIASAAAGAFGAGAAGPLLPAQLPGRFGDLPDTATSRGTLPSNS